jgi:hypothetical protein
MTLNRARAGDNRSEWIYIIKQFQSHKSSQFYSEWCARPRYSALFYDIVPCDTGFSVARVGRVNALLHEIPAPAGLRKGWIDGMACR